MSSAARNLVVSIVLILGAGALLGFYFEHTLVGLLIAALLCLAWQVRQLLRLESASRNPNIVNLGYGDGIWQQIYARYSYQRDRNKRRKAKYRTLLQEVRKSTDAMPDGAVVLDAGKQILRFNRAAMKLTGLNRRKDRGQRIDNILRDPSLEKLLERDSIDYSVDILSPVDAAKMLNLRVVPYGANQKMLLIRDVTERSQLNKMRRDFVANASHELRTPLTVISGYLEALAEDDELADKWTGPIGNMQRQSHRMNSILAELLELSRLENAGDAPREEAIEVSGIMRQVRGSLLPDAPAAKIAIHEESDSHLIGSSTEIESLISNLLSNAIRFTPPDGEINLIWRPTESGAELVVEDNGDGIDAAHLPRLTERFYRVDRGRSREDGGVGLGLAIVKHIVARHNGQLDIQSELGKGSSFRCSFPSKRLS